MQSYVFNLRQAFAAVGQDEVIVTQASGYLAQVPSESLDVEVAQRLRADSRAAAAAGDFRRAAQDLREASQLWRGESLAGLDSALLAGDANRLEEMRLNIMEELFSAELSAGRHTEVVSELSGVSGRYPVNERIRGQLMLALYRSGRQSDALECFRRGREILIDELGVDPGPELTALHASILRNDETLAAAPGVVPVAAPAVAGVAAHVAPSQLPLVPADFTGRDAEIAALAGSLTATVVGVNIQVSSGRGGCGKSALAARAAQECTPSFPDGQLYAELRGLSDVPTVPGDVVGRFLRALGVAPAAVPDSTDERSELFRSVVATRRMLIVLDDAGSIAQVRALLPGGSGCAVLITSRDRLPGLAGATPTELDMLDPATALHLLTTFAGVDRVNAEPQAAAEIVERCGRLPLALRVAGARLAARKRWPLHLLADRLADEASRLDELSAGDLEVRASLALSYAAVDPMGQKALRRLSFLDVPDFSNVLPAQLLDVPTQTAADLLEDLVDTHLVDFAALNPLGDLRCQQHDLSRLYGRERAAAEDDTAELAAAVTRVLRGLLSIVYAINAASSSGEIQWRHRPIDSTDPEVVRRGACPDRPGRRRRYRLRAPPGRIGPPGTGRLRGRAV